MAELTRRYVVMALATEAPFDVNDPDSPFVLKPWKDPAALRALMAYREHCYPELARDLEAWIRAIEEGPVVRGDVGSRNEPHVRDAAPPTRARAGEARGATRAGGPGAAATRAARGKTRARASGRRRPARKTRRR
jgi:hypothetical protein